MMICSVISYHHPDDDDFLDHVQTEIQSVFRELPTLPLRVSIGFLPS
ncbi:hypothetical protein BMF77_03975 [Dolichospermum sp. UHCC 0315A]|jgi:hypothetical protein|nr:hypothetical protein BMF77_03975 [Dolichospermum sp. UHCC 0315A]